MAKTIIMIHGMWGGAWNWDNFKHFFQQLGYHCITPTLRFHDVSPQAEPDSRLGTTSLLDYAADLEKEIRELENQKLLTEPIIMGHSMGGLLAQILASRGLAKTMVLLTPAPSAPNAAVLEWSVTKSFWSCMLNWGVVEKSGRLKWGTRRWNPIRFRFGSKPHRQTFEEAAYAMMHLLSEKEQREAYERFVYESGRAAWEIGFWLLDSFRRSASKVDVSKITCPVLVVAGAEDRITPASVVKKLANKYGANPNPNAVRHYKEFPDHAHWVLGEPGWEEIATYVSDWLGTVIK